MKHQWAEGAVDSGTFGKLPDKEPGKHRWIATVAYSLKGGQASAAFAGSEVLLDAENRFAGPDVGCWDCERPYQEAKGKPCDAAEADVVTIKPGDTIATTESPNIADHWLLGRYNAAVDLIGRTGAESIETEHDEIGPDGVLWRCTAHYAIGGDTTIASSWFPYPAQSAEDLLARVMNGGQCTTCNRRTLLGIASDEYCSRTLTAGDVSDENTYRYVRGCDNG